MSPATSSSMSLTPNPAASSLTGLTRASPLVSSVTQWSPLKLSSAMALSARCLRPTWRSSTPRTLRVPLLPSQLSSFFLLLFFFSFLPVFFSHTSLLSRHSQRPPVSATSPSRLTPFRSRDAGLGLHARLLPRHGCGCPRRLLA